MKEFLDGILALFGYVPHREFMDRTDAESMKSDWSFIELEEPEWTPTTKWVMTNSNGEVSEVEIENPPKGTVCIY